MKIEYDIITVVDEKQEIKTTCDPNQAYALFDAAVNAPRFVWSHVSVSFVRYDDGGRTVLVRYLPNDAVNFSRPEDVDKRDNNLWPWNRENLLASTTEKW